MTTVKRNFLLEEMQCASLLFPSSLTLAICNKKKQSLTIPLCLLWPLHMAESIIWRFFQHHMANWTVSPVSAIKRNMKLATSVEIDIVDFANYQFLFRFGVANWNWRSFNSIIIVWVLRCARAFCAFSPTSPLSAHCQMKSWFGIILRDQTPDVDGVWQNRKMWKAPLLQTTSFNEIFRI